MRTPTEQSHLFGPMTRMYKTSTTTATTTAATTIAASATTPSATSTTVVIVFISKPDHDHKNYHR